MSPEKSKAGAAIFILIFSSTAPGALPSQSPLLSWMDPYLLPEELAQAPAEEAAVKLRSEAGEGTGKEHSKRSRCWLPYICRVSLKWALKGEPPHWHC